MPALGQKQTKEAREKIRKFFTGRKRPEMMGDNNPARKPGVGEKISKAKLGKPNSYAGSKHPWWKGGITPVNAKIRRSLEYRLWRKSVFERDGYTCVWCGRKGVKLQADHIKPFAYFPELRFAIDNGRTLCVDCHKKTDTYLNYRGKNPQNV